MQFKKTSKAVPLHAKKVKRVGSVRSGRVVSATPRQLYPLERDLIPTVRVARWVSEPVRMGTGNEENMWTLQNVQGNPYDTRDFAIAVFHPTVYKPIKSWRTRQRGYEKWGTWEIYGLTQSDLQSSNRGSFIRLRTDFICCTHTNKITVQEHGIG
jgi:hypothetical protein